MPNKIGRFEILGEIAHSEVGCVYKASDPESGQTVALKTIRLETLGEQGPALVKSILDEAEASKVLNSHNIALLYGAGEIDGNLCAAMEYVQGNSIATMLARKEGFSIWDLQDIARQTCQGLDHANARNVVHYSLEPAKIMVQWDGIVKILSFGVSSMGGYAAQAIGEPPAILHYMSPEQLRGDPLDASSNLFSLGAILYEMVTGRKAFDGEDADQVRRAILETSPEVVDHVNPKIHPALSAAIMKALSKAPEERYHSGQELVTELEKSKQSGMKHTGKQELKSVSKAAVPAARTAQPPTSVLSATPPMQALRSKSAAAGGSGSDTVSSASLSTTPKLDVKSPLVTSSTNATVENDSTGPETQSVAASKAAEVYSPKIATDPMMDESRQPGVNGPRFSEVDQLPPLKEIYVPLSPTENPVETETEDPIKTAVFKKRAPEKPKMPPRIMAKKAISEIKQTPPQLFMYAIAGAVALILIVVGGIAYHIHSSDTDDESPLAQAAPATSNTPAHSNAGSVQPVRPAPEVVPEPPVEEQPAVQVTPKYNARPKKYSARTPAVPAIIPGQINIDSTPQAAQVQLDGQSANAITPCNLAGLMPGQHTITISKSGYGTETRTIAVNSGSKSIISVQLLQLTATVAANSNPAGATVWIDGKDTGRVTPVQLAVDKPGSHSFVFKKQGYLDETTTANLQIGQTVHLGMTLRALGSTDEIRFGGKFKKVFGRSETAGMGTVSVKTQPKGAQVAVNNRIVDKLSPVEFYLNPGNYVVDITMSGFKNIHKVITVEKNGKVVVEENLDRE